MQNNEQPLDALSEEQAQQWVREQYQVATKYLADKGVVTESVMVEDSRYIAPLVAIWKLKSLDEQWYWVICGDLPSDHIHLSAAKTAKEALTNFSLKWQLQAENILNANPTSEQQEFANILIGRAEGLFKLSEKAELWPS